jgi:muconolactone D-isomerase
VYEETQAETPSGQRRPDLREAYMLFYVSIAVLVPQGEDPEKIKELVAQEAERAKELKRQGKWLHVWRVVGKWANVSIFKVDSNIELHQILSSLPLFPYLEIKVTPLCSMHPEEEMAES